MGPGEVKPVSYDLEGRTTENAEFQNLAANLPEANNGELNAAAPPVFCQCVLDTTPDQTNNNQLMTP